MLNNSFVKKYIPWTITLVAIYLTFRNISWLEFFSHARNANPLYLLLALFLTAFSYVLRTFRWQLSIPSKAPSFLAAYRALILGFFYNNVLPARAGEFIRAVLGARVFNQSRTLIFASVALERIVDGLSISLFFIIFANNLGDSSTSHIFNLVALGFLLAAIGAITVLLARSWISIGLTFIEKKLGKSSITFVIERLHLFLDGLKPLTKLNKLIPIISWSLVIWFMEIFVFYFVGAAYGANLSIGKSVLFLVAVNFSGLIPAAPGGLGVIEAAGTAALLSIGVPKELALILVLSQHTMQYIVTGFQGVYFSFKADATETAAIEASAA